MKPKMKRIRRMLCKCSKGAISILLCLLMTPFLTISLSLVEYARYQEVLAITDELMELSGMSALTDYDPYLHNRFGLLATSQSQNISNTVDGYLQHNKDALGSQITVQSTSASGKLALSNEEVLRQQIIDVAELTGPTTVLLDDFNLSELKAQLGKVKKIEQMMNTINSVAEATGALSTAVDKAEALKTAITNAENAVKKASETGNTAADLLKSFYEKLHNNGISFPDTLTLEELKTKAGEVAETYGNDVVEIYNTVNSLITQVKDIKTKFGAIKTAATELSTALGEVRKKLSNVTGSGDAQNKDISGDATSTLTDVVTQMENMVTETLNAIKDDTIKEINATVDKIVDESLKSLGITEAINRYKALGKGEYLKSEQAKQDILNLVKLMPEVWDSKSPQVLLDQLKEMFAPKINFNFTTLKNSVTNTLENAATKIKDSATAKVLELLTKLVNIVRNLFSMTVFYDPELNAFVDDFSGEGGYQGFLTALSKALNAVTKFTEAMDKDGLAKIKAVLEAIKELFEGFGELLKALVEVTTDTFNSMWELISSLGTGDVRNIYERLLIASYAAHNLPNRTSKARNIDSDYNDGDSRTRYALDGTGMTGFDYNQIARPYSYIGQNYTNTTGINGLVKLFNDLKNGKGSDTMFKGAEMEAVLASTNSEILNQTIVFFNVYFVRLLCSLPGVFADTQVHEVAAAATIACWVVYLLYALIEPFCDCLLLVNGGTVPIIKLKCHLTPTGIGDFLTGIADATMGDALKNSLKEVANADGKDINPDKKPSTDSGGSGDGGGGGGGIMSGLSDTLLASDYDTHMLLLALMNLSSDELIHRLSIIIRMETEEYYRQKNSEFKMSKAYTALQINSNVTFNPFVDLGLLAGDNPLEISKKMKCFVGY